MAASKEFKEIPYPELPRPRNNTDFIQESVDPGTFGTEVFSGDFSVDVDGNLTAFDNTPVVQRTDTPNEVSKPEPEQATTVQKVGAAHYAVWKNLNHITFVPGSACQMSQAIAYIRYWSKEGVQKKTEVEAQEQSTAPTDPQEEVSKELEEKYSDTPETTNNENQQQKTRTVLTVPDNSAYQSRPRQPVPTSVPVTKSQPEPKAGKIVSANPSGIKIMNPVSGVVSAPNITDAVWMFLLNPEELQLSSGPDYNRAETWGVSDSENSGQPLSWRSNRNKKLSFGKVLLHGYTFGKRVDTLEAGLQQLFMAREGEGSDGPPVLEFVWGKRFFGPCVIQNIQVREKAWDKGILVNAEVSFELEQVPEWTINDGEVDVLRPGRQPTVNDPILPQGQYNQPEGNPDGNEPPASKPGGGNPQPTSKNNPTLCNTALVAGQNFQGVVNLGDDYLGLLKFPGKERYDEVANKYARDYFKYQNTVETIAKPALSSKSPGCFRMDRQGNVDMRDLVADGNYARGIRFARGCAVDIKTALDQWVGKEAQGGKCDSLRKAREAAEEAKKAETEAAKKAADQRRRAQEEKQKCKRFENKINSKGVNIVTKCSNSQLSSQTTCLGKVYVCQRLMTDGKFNGQLGWVEK